MNTSNTAVKLLPAAKVRGAFAGRGKGQFNRRLRLVRGELAPVRSSPLRIGSAVFIAHAVLAWRYDKSRHSLVFLSARKSTYPLFFQDCEQIQLQLECGRKVAGA